MYISINIYKYMYVYAGLDDGATVEEANVHIAGTATHCNTIQHTATHCNTLQHTATHCNTLI